MSGEPLDRRDGVDKVTGKATYAAEWRVNDLLHAVIVQSTIPNGTIEKCDASAAEEMPGVQLIMTPDNAPQLPQEGKAGVNPPSGRVLTLLQDRRVHYNGQPIALVVADTFEHATAAAAGVKVSYRPLQPTLDMVTGARTAPPYTQKILGSDPRSHRGDVPAALAAAAVRIDAVYTTPIETHNPLEPHATIAEWNGDRLTLHDATQYVWGVKRFVAKTFGIGEDQVDVVAKFIGGAFGCKGSPWSHVVLAAMAARQLRKPVKLVLSRHQMFGLVGARPYTRQHFMIGAERSGKITAIRQDVASSTSVFEDWVEPSTMQTRMLYDVPNVETIQRLVKLNVGTPTFNRGPGESTGTFGLESAIDELAYALKVDPIEIRLEHYADRDPETGRPWSSKSLRECYRVGADRIDWRRRTPAARSMRDGRELVGLGMATATYPARRQPASAIARLTTDGDFVIAEATHELGTGTLTVIAQAAADALGVTADRVTMIIGDSRLPENPISAGSMTVASSGSAAFLAARALKAKLDTAGVAAVDRDACRRFAGTASQPIQAEAKAEPGPEAQQYAMHVFGAVFAEVRVDPDLGVIRVPRMVGAYGAGRILNAKTARSQIIGGIVYGLSMALTEHTIVDPVRGRYVNADLGEYLVPVNADVRDIDVSFVEETDTHVNEIGAKGIGEVGTTGVAAAVANAVFHATGVRVRDLPITLDKLL